MLSSEVRPIDLQGHSGEGAEQQQPSPTQPLKTSEESSSWYRYVPRTFFNTPSFQTTYRGQNSSFLSKLAGHYQRPLGSKNCGGVQDRFHGITSPDLHSYHACIRGGERLNRPGSSLSPTKTCYPQGFRAQWSQTNPVHKPLIHCSQKGGWTQASNKPQRIKPLCRISTFQNGRCTNVERSSKTKRLSNQDRLKGCLPYCPNMDPSPKIPAIHLAGYSMGVCMPSLRTGQCTPHILQATKTSCSPVKKNGNQINHLPRRHAHYGRIQRFNLRTHHHCSQPVIQPRFCDKRREVYLSTYTRTRVPRFPGKFNQNAFVPPKGQVKEHQEGVSGYDKNPFSVNQNTISASGKTVLFYSSSFPSTPALPLSSDGQDNGFEENSKLRINNLS